MSSIRFQKVAVGRHSSWESNVDNYRSLAGNELIDEIRKLSKGLQGLPDQCDGGRRRGLRSC